MKATVLLVIMPAYCIFILPACDAAEETVVPVPIILPGDEENFPVAVYFADNMVFTPQWRIGNLVRIEMIVIDLRGPGGGMQPKDVSSLNMNIYEKSELMQDPTLIANTRMVSVSHIHVEIVDQDGTMV
ncbi:MAG: hypothetical protein E4H30_03270 [Methanomassiliicoccus sp.]|nr:MAG: hypothetical protein E4H30_03270 [Methanomassiliicoccus sp.]